MSAHSSASRARRVASVRAKVQRVHVKRFRRALLAHTIRTTAHQATLLVCPVLRVRLIPSRAVTMLGSVSTAYRAALLTGLDTANVICAQWASIKMHTARSNV